MTFSSEISFVVYTTTVYIVPKRKVQQCLKSISLSAIVFLRMGLTYA